MSLSTLQSKGAFQSVPSGPVVMMGIPDAEKASGNYTLAQVAAASKEEIQSITRLEIPDSGIVIPEQLFTFRFTNADRHCIIENTPENYWPKIRVDLEADSSDVFQVKQFLVRPSSNTADAEVKYTRVQLCLSKTGRCFLNTDWIDKFPFRFEPYSDSDMTQLVHRAKLFRKLKFIEQVFQCQFRILKEISGTDTAQIEFLFRGLTEGEFTTRGDSVNIVILPIEVDLNNSPYNGPGYISSLVSNQEILFGRTLDTGVITVAIEKAELASPSAMRQIRQKGAQPVDARFAVLDHQVMIRFESYAQIPKKELKRRLNKFIYDLSREEPEWLARLVSESLINDVSSDKAIQIAVGWQQYNNLPDRYCPQEPELDASVGHWRVPIWLTYPSGEGGGVGEILIDLKTGKIISHTPIDELRRRGKNLAAQIFHASETTPLPTGD